jgi:hypothetical protein
MLFPLSQPHLFDKFSDIDLEWESNEVSFPLQINTLITLKDLKLWQTPQKTKLK